MRPDLAALPTGHTIPEIAERIGAPANETLFWS